MAKKRVYGLDKRSYGRTERAVEAVENWVQPRSKRFRRPPFFSSTTETTAAAGSGITVLIDWPILAAEEVVPLTSDDWDLSSLLLTMPDDHGIEAGETVDFFWSTGWRSSRLGLTVDSVSVNDVTVSGGTGDSLPSDATPIAVGPYRLRPVTVGLKVLSGDDLRPTPGTETAGTLDTRSSDTIGILGMDTGHGLLLGEEIFLFWSSSNFARAHATLVAGDDVSFTTDGDDDVLPATTTAIAVTHYAAQAVANRWPEAIDPGNTQAYVAKAKEGDDGVMELLVWTCKSSAPFSHPPIPPA